MLNNHNIINYFNMLFGMYAVKHICLQSDFEMKTIKENSYENS